MFCAAAYISSDVGGGTAFEYISEKMMLKPNKVFHAGLEST